MGGLPDELAEASDRGLLRLGGCVVSSLDRSAPTRVCLKCSRQWNDVILPLGLTLDARLNLPLLAIDIMEVIKQNEPVKARWIALKLSEKFHQTVERKTVNQILYKMKNEKLVNQNERYEWQVNISS